MNESATPVSTASEKNKITTLVLADDHPVVRKAIRNELQKDPDFKVIGEATDGDEAVALVQQLKPNIVVMDIGMPRLNGIEATRQIKRFTTDTIVLVLTIYDDIEHILAILEAGAEGYLTKNVLVEEIIQSIRGVVSGETVLSPQIFQQVLRYALRHNTKAVPVNTKVTLTVREMEILKLVAQGLSNKKIAEELDLGIRTVKSHLVDVYCKMNVFSRTEAVITSLRIGLLKLEDLT